MITSSVLENDISREFEIFEKRSDMLADLRADAINTFHRLGFPTTKHEEWKYTSVKEIVSHNLDFSVSPVTNNITPEEIEKFRIGGKNALVLVFINGIYNPQLSDKLPESKIKISSIADAITSGEVKNYLGKISTHLNESFVALNTAFITDGIFIHIPAGEIVEQPVHFLHIGSSESPAKVATIRNIIVAEKNSKISVIESYHATDATSQHFCNTVTDVLVNENAIVELVKAQLDSEKSSHISFTQVIQERNSTFDTVTVTLWGNFVRNNLHIKLNNVNCTSHLFGLYILDGDQLVDNHTLVDHAKPNCYSNELYKGLIGGRASGVFNGKIFVRKDAQKTNAYQSNKNILLTDEAQINTKPQLEIFADDVKCTHGATTGQMDEDALFYLRARGIGELSAKALLNIAFAGDVLNNIKNETLRENLLNLAVAKLRSNED